MSDDIEQMYDDSPTHTKWDRVHPSHRALSFNIVCCDCGLTHTYTFRATKKHLKFVATRNPTATRKERRRHPYRYKRSPK
jgi:hypothetical protein